MYMYMINDNDKKMKIDVEEFCFIPRSPKTQV